MELKSFKKKIDFIRLVMNSEDVYQLKTVDGKMINFFDIIDEDQITEGVRTDANDGEYIFIDKTIVVEDGKVKEVKKIEVEEPKVEEEVKEEVVETVPEDKTEVPSDVVEEIEKTEVIEEVKEVEAPVEEQKEEPKPSIDELMEKVYEAIGDLTRRIDAIEERISSIEMTSEQIEGKVKNLAKFSSAIQIKPSEVIEEKNESRFSFARK